MDKSVLDPLIPIHLRHAKSGYTHGEVMLKIHMSYTYFDWNVIKRNEAPRVHAITFADEK